jgi:hypothetical protein
MWIPVPSPEAVKRFRKLYKKRFDIDLPDVEAQRLAQKTLMLVFILERYGLLPDRSEDHE